MAVITRTKSFEFRAMHALLAGPAPESLHGHTYHVEVTTAGAEPGVVDEIVEREVVRRLHGGVIEVAPSTGENIVEWIDARLRASAIGNRLRAVALRETAKNRYVSAASEARHV